MVIKSRAVRRLVQGQVGGKETFHSVFWWEVGRIEPVGRLRPASGCNIDMVMGLDWINLVVIGTSVSLL